MARRIEKALNSMSSDVGSWIRINFRRTLRMSDATKTPLVERLMGIASNAFHTNFPGDSDYTPDGLGLSKLRTYKGKHSELVDQFLEDLRQAPDLCGYISTHLSEAGYGRMQALA